MLTSVYSLIKNSKFDKINLYIVTSEFTNKDYDKIKKFLDIFENVLVYFYKLEDYDINKLNIPSWRGTQIANARLVFPDIIGSDNDIESILYIDSDTIIKDDLRGLLKYKDNIVSACLEDATLKSYYISKLNLDKYFNSGVIYFNTKKWKELDAEYRIKNTLSNTNIDITFPDQDLFNIIFNNETSIMPSRYNMSTYPYLFNNLKSKVFYNPKYRQLGFDEIKIEKENAKILHSYGLFNIKPWCNANINPFSKEFMKYMNDVNPYFKKEELNVLKKLLITSPELLKIMLVLRTYLPSDIEECNRKLSLKLQKAIEK